MRVRVYDKEHDKYFKSMVYAIINQGWFAQYLVVVPFQETPHFKLYEHIDKSRSQPPFGVNVNVVTPDVPIEWIKREGSILLNTVLLLKGMSQDYKFDTYFGYPWLFHDNKLLVSLLAGQSIPCGKYSEEIQKIGALIDGWNNVESQEDADALMKEYHGFHDSVLVSQNYVSGSEVFEDGSMSPNDDLRRVTMIFDSQWNKRIEMVFDGVLSFNLRPAQDNYTAELFDASMFVKDEMISFYDEYMEDEPSLHEGTWIRAFGLRWRYVNK